MIYILPACVTMGGGKVVWNEESRSKGQVASWMKAESGGLWLLWVPVAGE